MSKTVGWPLPVPDAVINSLGYEALSAGKSEEAISLFLRNIAANPNSAEAFDSLADGHAKAGRWQQAADASDKSVALATQFNNPNLAYFKQQAKKMRDRLNAGSKSPD